MGLTKILRRINLRLDQIGVGEINEDEFHYDQSKYFYDLDTAIQQETSLENCRIIQNLVIKIDSLLKTKCENIRVYHYPIINDDEKQYLTTDDNGNPFAF